MGRKKPISKGGVFGVGASGRGEGKNLKLSQELSKAEAWTEAILPADADAEATETETNRRPLAVFAVILGAVMVLLVLRLATLQLLSGSQNLAIANGNLLRTVDTRAPRGLIYDTNGNIIAKNQPAYDITVTPSELPASTTTKTALYAQVGAIIGMSTADVQAKAQATCSTELACSQSYQPQLVKPDVTQDQALLFDQDADQLTGFALDVNPTRQYVDVGNLLAPFLGYTGRINAAQLAANPSYQPTDLIGEGGLESSYESTLKGQDGKEQTEVDATGKPVKTLASQPSVAGNNIVLSIDQGLEQEMANDIQAEMVASHAPRAAGVAVNPNTGAILAAVSLPTYDNNEFAQGISQTDYNQLINNPGQPLFNKVIDGEYPSGSIIKPLVASAALQEGVINTSTVIVDAGKLVVPNENNPAAPPAVYNGWDLAGLGPMKVFSALAESSDIFFYTVAGGFTNFTHYLGITKLAHYYQLFGLGSKTGVDLPDENAGRVPTPAWKKAFSNEDWYLGDTYNTAIGQGDLLVTPLQMAMATSVVANGGNLLKPYFVSRITDASGKTVQTTKTTVTRSGFISPQNLAIVRQGMLATTQDPKGTACCRIKAEVPVLVGGKTGSAETNTAAGVQPEAWFSAFAPYNNPQIVIVIFLEKAGEGADYAAPAAREILKYYFTQGAGTQFVGH
jgi:penicillin-binding protein 2